MMHKTKQRDIYLRQGIRFYLDDEIAKSGDQRMHHRIAHILYWCLTHGLVDAEIAGLSMIVHTIDHMVVEGELYYGDPGQDTIVRVPLEDHRKMWSTVKEVCSTRENVVNYLATQKDKLDS